MGKLYTIYMHICPNGKRYIGVTSTRLNLRWQNGRGYKKQIFNFAIQKYGWENIKSQILMENLTREEAEHWERYYISFYKTTDDRFGYNVEGGGTLAKEISEETRKKMSRASTGRHHTEETKKRLSELKKGENAPWYGKEMSPEHRKKLSEALKGEKGYWYGKKLPDETKRKLSEAHKGYQCSEEVRKKLSAAGMGRFFSEESKKKMSDSSRKTPVMNLETGEVFESVKIASQTSGIERTTIMGCLSGRKKTAGGYHWAHVADVDPQKRMKIIAEIENSRSYRGISVKNLDTGEVFRSISSAAAAYNLDKGYLYACLSGRQEMCNGYRWAYLDENLAEKRYDGPQVDVSAFEPGKQRPIMNLDTREIFESVSAASRKYNISRIAIVRQIKGQSKTAGGYRWAYYNESSPVV